MNKKDYPLPPLSGASDKFFGTEVRDPYRCLESLDDVQVKAWLQGQTQLTAAYFSNIARQNELVRRKLTSLWHYPKYSVLSKEGDYYFFWGLDLTHQAKIQNQAVLYRMNCLSDAPIPVLNPNLLDPSGNSAITYQSFSRDGRLVSYTFAQDGSDDQQIHIRHTLDLFDSKEVLVGCKTVNIAWNPDNSGFYYNRFIDSPSYTEPIVKAGLNCIYWHALGSNQSEDTLIFAPEASDSELAFYPETSYDGRYLVLYATYSTEPHNHIFYRKAESTGSFTNLTAGTKDQFVFIGSIEDTFYFQTTWNAPKGQIIAIDLAQPESQYWQVVIPEQADFLTFVTYSGGNLVAGFLHSAYHRLKVFTLEGIFREEVNLPSFATISGLTGKPDSAELFISVESFTNPPSVYSYDLGRKELILLIKPVLDFQPEHYETKQVFYPSKDGTMIPMFLTYKKGICLNKANPTLLTGYGGFGISQTPIFLISNALWLSQGGILAVANVRGGGELGLDWHEQGRLYKKQNSFGDLCAAAEWLIEENYTSPAKLALMGHSNGGLLVAGSIIQSPHLFGAVICRAPLTDMLRYHLLGAGRNWLAEYGCAMTSPQEFRTLYAYSPLHNIKKEDYPAVFVTVPIGDERVHPMHSLKFIANLQASSTGENPILLRIEREGGHGIGNASSRTFEELCDIYTFLFSLFEMI